MGDEDVIQVGRGQVVESFESQGEYFEMYMLLMGRQWGVKRMDVREKGRSRDRKR